MIDTINGYKTYIVAFLLFLYALLSVFFGQMTIDQAVAYVLGAGGIAAMRHGISKIGK